MKKVGAIFFFVLYTAFLCFAALGAFVIDGKVAPCTTTILCAKHNNNIIADNNQDGCSNKLFTAVHIYQKQTNSTTGGNKYIQPYRLSLLQQSNADFYLFNAVNTYSTATTYESCPLFIRNRALLL